MLRSDDDDDGGNGIRMLRWLKSRIQLLLHKFCLVRLFALHLVFSSCCDGPLSGVSMPHSGLNSPLTLSPPIAAALSMRDGNQAF